jgi:ATP-dependent DNA helicase DinG
MHMAEGIGVRRHRDDVRERDRQIGVARARRLIVVHARAAQLGHDLAEILSPSPDAARWVAWPNSGPELRAAPLDVGRRLSEGLFSRAIPVILTSATLSSGDGLGDFKSRVGLVDARELSLDSPFDYRSQAALWCVPDLPHPSDDPEHARAIAEMCEKIISRVPGGVFLLFSSWKVLKQVHGLLRQTIKNRPVWAQGNSGHDALIDQFEKAGNAVLLGVDTFWQGVDVPGEALSCVVLTKLPFGNVGSPLEEARRRWFDDNGRDYFRDWSLPKAVMKFRQGFGRLIRSGSDRGAVICLDPRIVKKGYGRFFLEALPSCRQIESLDELERFFQPVASPREPAQ